MLVEGERRDDRLGAPANNEPRWTFLTNHAAVLLHIANRPDDTMRSIADWLGMTERTTASVIADLRAAGYIRVRRRGRHNHYNVNDSLPLRRRAHENLTVHDLLQPMSILLESRGVKAGRRGRGAAGKGAKTAK